MSESQGMSNKIQLGLSAVMFFAPLVQSVLKSPTIELNEEDILFVQGYVRYGYLTITLLVCSIIGTIAYYFSPVELLYWAHTFCIFVLFTLLVAGTVGVVADFHVLQFGAHEMHPQRVHDQGSTIVPAFAPLYNIYLWYKMHTFDTPFWWAKESILWWSCFVLLTLFTASPILSSFVFILMILRLATLTYGMDYMSPSMKQVLQNLFRVNPEEIRSYIIAGIHRVYIVMNKHTIQESYEELVSYYKTIYTKLVPVTQQKERAIWVEWFVGLLIGTGLIYHTIIHGGLEIGILAGVLLVGRYVTMTYYWKHIPHLPLAKELVEAGNWLITNRHILFDRLYHFTKRKPSGE